MLLSRLSPRLAPSPCADSQQSAAISPPHSSCSLLASDPPPWASRTTALAGRPILRGRKISALTDPQLRGAAPNRQTDGSTGTPLEFWDTIRIYWGLSRFGPGFPRRSVRPSVRSTTRRRAHGLRASRFVHGGGVPGPRPPWVLWRESPSNCRPAPAAAPRERVDRPLPPRGPRRCSRVVPGVAASPARTGFCSMYRAATSKYGSSTGHEPKRPCQR